MQLTSIKGSPLTKLLAFVHGESSNNRPTDSTYGAGPESHVFTGRRWGWLLSVSRLLIPWPRLTISLRLIVASAASAALWRIATSVARSVGAARWPVGGLRARAIEGPLARLRIDVDLAVLALVPFGVPRWG
jgi:hypothetical protein